MKTTIDLPEDLIREMKFRAVREGRKLREVAEEVFRRGLAAPAAPCRPGGRHRVKLPLVPKQPGSKPFELSGKRLLELEKEADRNPSALAQSLDGRLPGGSRHLWRHAPGHIGQGFQEF